MKHYFLLLFLLTGFGYCYSQTTVPGYYVTNTNDTIKAQIKIPKSVWGSDDLSKFFNKVEVVDNSNNTKKFKPEDIRSYGFLYNDKQYLFFSKPTISINNLKFLQPIIRGQKTSLYYFDTVNQNGARMGTFYTLEKTDGTYIFLISATRLSKYRNELKDFYKDNTTVQQLIDTKFQSKTSIESDLIKIVEAVNKL
ncbi:hypothetical protein [Flavobacterium poyangense]|uniref:hypothetical protein n=1 Tax=Flavobacterium poyangense TaxID=2204302 RepID=UPI00141F42CE|nr:hypothetical protein [Flavobacterium sp. JXAS1]